MRRILSSLLTVVAVALVAVGATTAFFTDVETSSDNTFQSGDLDLTIDNTSYLNSGEAGSMELVPTLSWTIDDLTNQLFFSYSDIKPGDLGEDTISFHVTNDSWLCAEATLTADDDVTCEESETTDDPTCTEPGEDQGELASQLEFVFWADDGDNVLETGESTFGSGTAIDILDSTWVLSDSQNHNVGGGASVGPLIESTTYYVGKAWCFGSLTPTPVTQDNLGAGQNNGPDVRGAGVTCNGSGVDNSAMTDLVMADLDFTATQAKNNPNFLCVIPL